MLSTYEALPMHFQPTHPHGRGERTAAILAFSDVFGSSPRSWGTQTDLFDLISPGRFIPTVVGNAREDEPYGWAVSVHPHGRGERGAAGAAFLASIGSFPRSWGTQLTVSKQQKAVRFIPTVMGNAQKTRPPPGSNTVHPHGRGERALNTLADLVQHGSSPRSWGTHFAGTVRAV